MNPKTNLRLNVIRRNKVSPFKINIFLNKFAYCTDLYGDKAFKKKCLKYCFSIFFKHNQTQEIGDMYTTYNYLYTTKASPSELNKHFKNCHVKNNY